MRYVGPEEGGNLFALSADHPCHAPLSRLPQKSGKSKGGRQLNPELEAVTGKFKKSDKGKEYSKETIQNRMCARFVKEAILCLQVRAQ